MSSKFVIKFKNHYVINDTSAYATGLFNHFPVFSKNIELVKGKYIFNDKTSAQAAINRVIICEVKRARSIIKDHSTNLQYWSPVVPNGWLSSNTVDVSNNYNYGERQARRKIKQIKKITKELSKVSLYTIVPYDIQFRFDKSKKSKSLWFDIKKATYCSCCGMLIPQGKMYRIKHSNICVFCIKELNKNAELEINELKKDNPNIEDDYKSTWFADNL